MKYLIIFAVLAVSCVCGSTTKPGTPKLECTKCNKADAKLECKQHSGDGIADDSGYIWIVDGTKQGSPTTKTFDLKKAGKYKCQTKKGTDTSDESNELVIVKDGENFKVKSGSTPLNVSVLLIGLLATVTSVINRM